MSFNTDIEVGFNVVVTAVLLDWHLPLRYLMVDDYFRYWTSLDLSNGEEEDSTQDTFTTTPNP